MRNDRFGIVLILTLRLAAAMPLIGTTEQER